MNREQTEAGAARRRSARRARRARCSTERDAAWLNLDEERAALAARTAAASCGSPSATATWQLELRGARRQLRPRAHAVRGSSVRDARWTRTSAAGRAWVLGGDDPTEIAPVPRAARPGPAPTATRCASERPREPGRTRRRVSHDAVVRPCARSTASDGVSDAASSWTATERSGAASSRSVAETPSLRPSVELTRVGDRRGFHAAIVRPRDFEPGAALPGDRQRLRRPARADGRCASPRATCSQQWIADHGFIVVVDRRPRHARTRPRLGARDQERPDRHPARRPGRGAAGARRALPGDGPRRASASTAGRSAATSRRMARDAAARRLPGRGRRRAGRRTGATTTRSTPSATWAARAEPGRLRRAARC